MARGGLLTAVLAACILPASLLAAAPGRADPPAISAGPVVSPKPDAVALVIYQDEDAEDFPIDDREDADQRDYYREMGLALVSEWRTIEVPAGETAISFQGVAEGIVPQTAALDGLPATLVESNQDYDLLSPGSLIDKRIGAPVKRITTNPATGQETVEDAILRSGPNGVVLEVNGRFEALNCGGQPQRLVFQRPPGLADKPTLTLKVRARTAGRYRVRLSYLTTGLLWRARYVLSLDAEARRLDMTGWISLINTGGTTFAEAPTQVVAGDVARSDLTAPTLVSAKTVQPRCWPMDTTTKGRPPPPPPMPPLAMPAPSGTVEDVIVTARKRQESLQYSPIAVATQSELGDYKLYSLPFPTTVAARQSKQVMMLRQPGIKVAWFYVVSATPDEDLEVDDEDPEYAVQGLKSVNSRKNGLGVPLPGGRVSFYQAMADGPSRLLGQGVLVTAPVGAPLEIGISVDPLVRLRRTTLATLDVGDDAERRNRIEISNDHDRPIVLEYRLRGYDDEPYRIVAQSRPSCRGPYGTVWTLKVPAHGKVVLTYSVRTE